MQNDKIDENPNLIIEEIRGGLGVTLVIKNTGDDEAKNVTWVIDLDGDYILTGPYTLPPYPVIRSIYPGESVAVSSYDDRFIFGFGKTNINVFVEDDTGMQINKTAQAFAIGFYIRVIE